MKSMKQWEKEKCHAWCSLSIAEGKGGRCPAGVSHLSLELTIGADEAICSSISTERKSN